MEIPRNYRQVLNSNSSKYSSKSYVVANLYLMHDSTKVTQEYLGLVPFFSLLDFFRFVPPVFLCFENIFR